MTRRCRLQPRKIIAAQHVNRAVAGVRHVLIAKEVNPVLKALREHGIEVTAIHNHMLDDQPRLYFMDFWANDDAKKLAEGLKAALAQIIIAKS
jgi:hypothetical protein